MKRILFVLFVVVMVAVVIGLTTLASEPADEGGTPIYLTEIPEGYRDLRLISVSRLTAGNGSSQLRAQLGNDLAIRLIAKEKFPSPTAQSLPRSTGTRSRRRITIKSSRKAFRCRHPIFCSRLGREHAVYGERLKEIRRHGG
jgi:hypothetical protein